MSLTVEARFARREATGGSEADELVARRQFAHPLVGSPLLELKLEPKERCKFRCLDCLRRLLKALLDLVGMLGMPLVANVVDEADVAAVARANGRASTPEQRLRVRVLANEGFSKREIAERVYGDRGLYGRVERILKREGTLSSGLDRDPQELLARLETLAQELQEADLPDLDELTDLYKRRSLVIAQRRLLWKGRRTAPFSAVESVDPRARTVRLRIDSANVRQLPRA